VARWESELSQLMNSEGDRLEDIGNNVQQIYEANNYHPSAEEVLRYDDEGIPQLGPYVFGMLTVFCFSVVLRNIFREK
jgi:hypothetical protein